MDMDTFLDWADSRFDNIKVNGNEIKLNSVFCDDEKNHLWVNPEKGVYHCWKTDSKGSIYKLIAKVDHCSYGEVVERMGGNLDIALLEKRVKDFFELNQVIQQTYKSLELPPFSIPIKDLPNNHFLKIRALDYLKSRNINHEKFDLRICTSGKYYNRIIIPYYGANGSLIYFNSRTLGESSLRYLGPSKEFGVGKGDVLWMHHPLSSKKVYLTEGEFDAMTLCQIGLNGIACGGKYLTDTQINMLRDKTICLAFDADASGVIATKNVGLSIKASILDWRDRLFYLKPPNNYKDWNNMYCAISDQYDLETAQRVLNKYIEVEEKSFNSFH